MKDCFEVEDKKGYIKYADGSVQLTGLDGRQNINVSYNASTQRLIVSYHGNEVSIDMSDIDMSDTFPKTWKWPQHYNGEEPIGKGAISRPRFKGDGQVPLEHGIKSFDHHETFDKATDKMYEQLHAETAPIATQIPPATGIKYKYAEDRIITDFKAYIDRTYDSHYNTDDNIQVLDGWLALGSFVTTCRDVALKYLWRYGKKDGNAKSDLMKAMHYTLLCMFKDHYS